MMMMMMIMMMIMIIGSSVAKEEDNHLNRITIHPRYHVKMYMKNWGSMFKR